MAYRGRRRRRSKLALATPPVVMAAAVGVSVTASAAQPLHPPHPAADSQRIAADAPEPGFAAGGTVIPFVTRTVTIKKHRPGASGPLVTLPTSLDVSAASIPRRVLASYLNAAKIVNTMQPGCHLAWQTLAGIGLIESDHARSGGSANPKWDGIANPPIYGPALNGSSSNAQIANTTPEIDGSGQWARAVGPMQFIPSTWASWAADGNGDGVKNPEDIDDATLAAGDYLCAAAQEQNQPKHLIRAVYAYNHSYKYVKAVLTAAAGYENIDPKQLGIDGLPGAPKHKHKPKRPKGKQPAAASPSPTPTTSTSPTPRTSPSETPTPTPTPTDTGTPVSPTPSPTQSVPAHAPSRPPRR
jgi:membrane-bound lytic murein transglycosylase B